jgi:CubicO group peptidase (beta-lactamase class C family)
MVLRLVVIFVAALVAAHAAERTVKRLDGSTITAAEIDSSVWRLMRDGHVSGLAVAILNDRKIVLLKTYGERDTEKHLPLTQDSVMTAASYTKSTFAFAVMQL